MSSFYNFNLLHNLASAEKVTGWAAEDAIGHSFLEIFVVPNYAVALSKVISDAMEVYNEPQRHKVVI